jgi:hypothetical protein
MVAQLSANMFAGSLPTGPAPTEAELRARYDAAKAASAKRRAEGFLGQVVLPGEEDFESYRALQLTPYGGGPPLGGQPPSAEMIAAEMAAAGPLPLSDTPGSASGIEIKGDPNFIADQDISKLINVIPEEALKGGGLLPNSGFSENLEGTAEAGGILPNVVKDPNPINHYMGRPTNMTTDAEIANFEAVNNPNPMQDPLAPFLPSNKKLVDGKIVDNGNPLVAPDMTQRPMPFSGLASLTKLPMFQEFATKLESEHPEASQLFSQMFMGSSQRPMPYQNPFMGMGMGSFYPMMGGMGMGGYNPMMGGMGMGGYSPFMGMNPMMGMGGYNPMMGMGGGGLGSFYPQPSTYGPPQSMPSMGGYPTPPQSSPFGGAMRGYYA